MAWTDAARAASAAARRAHAKAGTPAQRSRVASYLRQARYHTRAASKSTGMSAFRANVRAASGSAYRARSAKLKYGIPLKGGRIGKYGA